MVSSWPILDLLFVSELSLSDPSVHRLYPVLPDRTVLTYDRSVSYESNVEMSEGIDAGE